MVVSTESVATFMLARCVVVVNTPVLALLLPTGMPLMAASVPPRETAVAPNVMLLFAKLVLAMFVNVLSGPLIVLLVSVSVPARVASVPDVGNVTPVTPVNVSVTA